MQNRFAVMTTPGVRPVRVNAVPRGIQLAACIVGVELAMAAAAGWIDGIDAATAKWSLVLLALGFALWIIPWVRGKPRQASAEMATAAVKQPDSKGRVWALALAVACTSLDTSLWTADKFGGSPPCFHDEYSYLLQAETFLRGRLSFPSHATMPDLFDQMHVLNEGKFASRYYPGTALWMAPFAAIGHPQFGHWFAGMLIAVLVFATGRELAGNLCGFIAGMVAALSPGMAIFSNLLLSSHPTMLGLSVFVFAFFRVLNTESWRWALVAGIGLAFALLCRPLTAVGVAAPFVLGFMLLAVSNGTFPTNPKRQRGNGLTPSLALRVGVDRSRLGYIARWFRRGLGNRKWVHMTAAGMLPVTGALLAILFYNHAISGNAWKSPWQLYNEIYTSRHVYGFNNGVRGDAAPGPKVVQEYDRWATNLTAGRALDNAAARLVQSWRWALGATPLLMTGVVVLFCPGPSRAGRLLLGGILGLHAAYFPYWYEGTLGFHYVFETIPLWALIYGLATAQLYRTWWNERRYLLWPWWASLALLSLAATYLPIHGKEAAIDSEIAQMTARRVDHARFLRLVNEQVTDKPALVLIDQGLVDSFVVNSPGLDRPLIFGRYRPKVHSLAEIAHAFPERTIYLFDETARQIKRVVESPPRAGK